MGYNSKRGGERDKHRDYSLARGYVITNSRHVGSKESRDTREAPGSTNRGSGVTGC